MAPQKLPTLAAGIAALAFGLLMFVPAIVLGIAIGWPASLSESGSVLMPLLAANQACVLVGYVAYVLYSVLFFPLIALVSQVLGDSATTRLATIFAGLSALARSIGILRWLTVLPALALAYETQADGTLVVVFDAINDFGGGIGELLGVSLFGAAALALTAHALATSPGFPHWLGISGYVVAAALLLPWLEVFGIDLGAIISVSVALVQLWFLALGVVLVAKSRRDARAPHSDLIPDAVAARS